MMIRMQWFLTAGLIVGLGLACTSTPAADMTTAGSTGTQLPVGGTKAPMAGTLGSAGTAAAGSAAPAAVPCGTTGKTCTAFTVPFVGALSTPCCADQATATCGSLMGTMCMPPPAVDMRCPAPTVLGMVTMPCCTASGMCGIDASLAGMGCLDLSGLGMGTPQRCDGTPLPAAGTGAGRGAAGSGGAGGAAGSSGAGGAAGHAGAGGSAGAGHGGSSSGTSGH
jgi:hypothetical protein